MKYIGALLNNKMWDRNEGLDMAKKKLLYSIVYCIFSVFIFSGCTSNPNEWENLDAEKVILYNEDQTTVLENKTEVEEFVDLLQVDSWELLNGSLREEMDQILVAELYKNEEMIGKIEFFNDHIIQFELGVATFDLEAENDVVVKVLDTFIAN